MRVFTRDAMRAAAEATLHAYGAEVAGVVQARTSGKIGDLATEQLPGRAALSRPGKREGDALMVRHGGKVEAYQVGDIVPVVACVFVCVVCMCLHVLDVVDVQWQGGAWVLTGEVTDAVDTKKGTFYIEIDGKVLVISFIFVYVRF